jgi:NAD(P)H-dependent flavin oxidoreductase YrpB (nitropropane dioxygenase family)
MEWANPFALEYGLSLPLVGAGMAMVAGPELVAAVSETGGLGVLGTGPLPVAFLRAQIEETRGRTRKPFGVNLIVADTALGPGSTAEHVEVCIAAAVSPVVFFWNLPPAEWLQRLKSAGIKAWMTVSSTREARAAAAYGADAIIVQGAEAGGHTRAQLGLFALLPAVRAAVGDMRLIAAGGIADGGTAAAAMLLGADAVCVGTRLLASSECLAREDYKARIVEARGEDTVVTHIFGPEWPDAPMRVLHNRAVAEGGPARAHESIGETTVFGQRYQLPHHSALLPTKETSGDLEAMCLAAGAGVSLIREIAPAGQVVRTLMADAAACLKRLVREVEDDGSVTA